MFRTKQTPTEKLKAQVVEARDQVGAEGHRCSRTPEGGL